MPRIPGINHLRAVAALEKVNFRVVRQGKHIVMSDGTRILTIPRHNPVNAHTMGGIAKDAGLSPEDFRKLLWSVPAAYRVRQEAEVADPYEASRDDMLDESLEESSRGERLDLLFIVVLPVLPCERDVLAIEGQDAVVRDRDAFGGRVARDHRRLLERRATPAGMLHGKNR